MTTKPEFHIDVSEGAASPLEALAILSALDPSEGYHLDRALRPALGIYNTSVSRICDKIVKCCQRLEQYCKTSTQIDVLRKENDLRKEIIDYIELSLYAAAEHVQDISSIAKGFFSSAKDYKSSKSAKELEQHIKNHKALISASANAIKHAQARIRLFSIEFNHGGIENCLHGYFVEGVHNGVVGPNKIFHSDDRQVFSITSLLWEINCFLLHASRCLSVFIREVTDVQTQGSANESKPFSKAVIAAARLPLYSFDDTHPFSETRLIIKVDEDARQALDSGIYGSLSHKWTSSDDARFGNHAGEYEGDGVTRQFKLVQPKAINLQHWG